jgi:hypothetical protein
MYLGFILLFIRKLNMTQQEDSINFEEMGWFSPNKGNIEETKEYDSLYDELAEKCNPQRFVTTENFNKLFFDNANEIYQELNNRGNRPDYELMDLREKAIIELGIHISTTRLYNHLIQYLDPTIYTSMDPYDANRVKEAGDFYDRLLKGKNDIHALEDLEKDAQGFIDQRIRQIKEEEQKREEKRVQMKIKQEEAEVAEAEEYARLNTVLIFTIIGVLIFLLIIMLFSSFNKYNK